VAATRKGRMAAWIVPLWAEAAATGRSVLLAWAIGPEELGRAMLLALTLRLAEMVSDIGVERMLMQSPDGDAPGMIAALQGAALARGLVMAGLLVALAWPMAWLLPDGADALSYGVLALIPLLRGMAHLDYRRAERGFSYGPLVMVEGGSTLVMLAMVPVCLWVWPDHRAILGALVAQAAAHLVLSHLVATRRFAVVFDRSVMRNALAFGLPLVLNAVLLFAIFQADRLIVAGFLGWADVAIYGVALQLAMLPAQITGRAAQSLLAPRLRVAFAQGNLGTVAQGAILSHVVLGALFATGFTLVAPLFVNLVYGEDFHLIMPVAAAFGIAAGFRILRTPLSQIAVATDRTGDPARANILRAFALIPATVAAFMGQPLAVIALFAALGEAAATLRAFLLLRGTIAAPVNSTVYA
jgi:O-antigen/teichoic acid export membrane protein